MTTIHASQHIDAPQQRVFEVFADLRNAPQRIAAIESLELLTDGPIAVGTRFRETRKMFGKAATEEMQISAFDPPRGYSVTADSCGARMESSFRFTPEAGGTRVDVEFAATPVTFMAKLLSPLSFFFAGTMKKCVMKDVDDLKRVLESKVPVS